MNVGVFDQNSPFVKITLAWGNLVKDYWLILDTGFTGEVKIPAVFAKELGLQVVSVCPMTIANGQTIQVPVSICVAGIEGVADKIEVLIDDGSPLLGIGFLKKFNYTAVFDPNKNLVYIEKNK